MRIYDHQATVQRPPKQQPSSCRQLLMIYSRKTSGGSNYLVSNRPNRKLTQSTRCRTVEVRELNAEHKTALDEDANRLVAGMALTFALLPRPSPIYRLGDGVEQIRKLTGGVQRC